MDPLLHQQQEMSNTLENMLVCSKENKKAKAQPEHALQCPRCESTNTKFCYYNNYSLSQPRYFCKSCRRYWTKGGTLRNVPVGGGCRKNHKRPSSSSSLSKRSQSQDHQQPLNMITSNQNSSYDSNDLTLAFARLQKQHLGFDHHDHISNTHQGGSFFDALRFGYLEAQNQNQNQNNFQNLCYGYARNGEVENGSGSYSGEGNGEVLVTTMKQEMCRDQGYDQSRSLLGLPWQINGDHHESININNMNHSDVDPARESWSGFAPSWHGLLNSPLM